MLIIRKMLRCGTNSIWRGDWAREQSTATTLVPGAKQMGSPIPAHERRESHHHDPGARRREGSGERFVMRFP